MGKSHFVDKEKKMRRTIILLIILVISPTIAAAKTQASSLSELLKDGPITQVLYNKSGKFKEAVGIIYIDGTPDQVWDAMTDYEHFIDFMPQVVEFKATKKDDGSVETYQEIEVPGFNYKYTLHNKLDKANYEITVTPISGPAKGLWSYKVVPFGKGSLLYYHCYSELPKIITKFEDEAQTMTIGVNAATSIAVVQAFKKRVEAVNKKGGN